jgi:iron(III) transport system permease protein
MTDDATSHTRLPALLGGAMLAVILLVLVVAPLGNILLQAVSDTTASTFSFTLAHFETVMVGSAYWEALLNTVAICGSAALGATVVGTTLAWIFVRTDTLGRGVLEEISQIPIFIPPFVGAVAWVLLFAPRVGAGNRILSTLDIPLQFDIYTKTGMLLVMSIYLAPYVMMVVAAAMRGIDPSLEEAAQVCGLGKIATAMRITVPLLSPAVLSAAVIVFTIAVGLFGTPVVIGWSRQILLLTSRIWISTQAVPPDYGVTAVLSFYLILLSVITMALQRFVVANRSFVTISGRGYRPHPIQLGPWMLVTLAVAVLYIALTILAPLAVLAAAAMSTYTWSGRYSLQNVWTALDNEDVWMTMQNSLYISIFSATAATIIGTVIAWIVHRTRFFGRQLLEYLTLLPIAVPGIAFGVGVMLTWIGSHLPVYGTAVIIMFAFVGRFTAYAVRAVSSGLVQLHPELEESARVCGYGPLRTFARITFPLIMPSIFAGWLLLFSFFMTELSMVILLYSASNRMFSILSFEIWNVGDFSKLAALSLMQTCIGLALAIILKVVFRTSASIG